MQLWEPNKKLADKKLEIFSSKSQYDKKNKNLPQKSFSSKRSYGQAESSFQSSIQVFCREAKEFADFPKLLKRLILFCGKALFFELFLWNMESSFGNPDDFFPTSSRIFSRRTSEGDMKNTRFSKSWKIVPRTTREQFWQHLRKSFNKWQFFSTQNHKLLKRFYFSQKD